MATTASKNLTPSATRGQIKIKVANIIAKSLQNLAIGVAETKKKGVRNGGAAGGCCSSMETAGGFKSGSESKIKQSRPKRGDVKIRIFKLIGKSVKDLAIGVTGREKKAAGNGGGSGGCFSSTTTVIPLETVGGFKPDFKYEIKQTKQLKGEFKINICKNKMIAGSMESDRKKKVGGGAWTGIVPMGLESEKER